MSESLRFDLLANDRASAVFDKLGRTVGDTDTKFSKMGATMAKVGKVAALGLAAGIGAGAVALAGMTKNAIEDQAAQQKLALGLKNSTDATDAQVAAAERWITAQGNALGVTDDELRPALQKLAQSTGSVGKAQKQLQIAMDVSAGSGKSLASVTEAMMKANNGSVVGLSRLGIATKNAAGETLGMQQIMGKAAATFGGQAAANADTLGGKMNILKLRFDEAKETIGAKLIPILTNLSDWVLSTGIPAVSKLAEFVSDNSTAFKVLAGVGGVLAGSLVAIGVTSSVYSALTTVAAAASKAFAAAQWLVNAALTANPIGLVIVAIAALGAGLVVAYKKSETFRNIVDGALRAVGGVFAWLGDRGRAILGALAEAWAGFRNRLVGIKDSIGNVLSNLFDPAQEAWSNTRAWVGDRWAAFREWVGGWGEGLAGKLGDIFGGLRDAWTTTRTWVEEKWGTFKSWITGQTLNFAGMFDGLAGAFKSAVNQVIAGWNNLSFSIPGFNPPGPGSFPGVSVGTPNIPYLADGGIVTRPTMAVVGEAGPEAVIPLPSGVRALGGGQTINFYVTINDATDPDAVVAAIRRYVKRNGRLRDVAAPA